MAERVVKDFNSARPRSFADIARAAQSGANPPQPIRTKPSTVVKKTPISKNDKLSDTWVLWSHSITEQAWDIGSYANLCEIKFDEEFEWLCQNFPPFDDYILYLMRKGIEPIWEDPKNRNGGCFSFKVNKLHYKDTWEELSRALICDYLINDIEDSETITGISINPRTNTIKIWNNDKEKKDVNILNQCVKWINYKGVMYKPHEIDETRKKETGYKTATDNTDPNKSEEDKINMVNRKLSAMISKMVKSNVPDYKLKLKKLEELFGRLIMYKAIKNYNFVNGKNENDYIFAKYKLSLISDLQCSQEIINYLCDKILQDYKDTIASIPRDKDISPKNIAELESQGKTDEIEDNIADTEKRNRTKENTVFVFNFITKKNITKDIDWNEYLDSLISEEYNPFIMMDGPLRLLIAIKSRINKEHFIEKIEKIKNVSGLSRKAKFAMDDIINFLKTGEKNQTIKEAFELFD
jgi:hypothetical protein